jgi:probable HAF family extracellular repeat protein
MNNQELNSRSTETAKSSGLHSKHAASKIGQGFFAGQSTRSLGYRGGPYGFAVIAFKMIRLALAAGFLLIPGVARAQQYVFEDIAFPGDTFTQLLSINDADVIAGYHGADINKGFTLTLPNNFTSQNFPGSAQTQVVGINDAGNTGGFYIDNGRTNHGFLNINGNFSTVDFPGTTFNQVLGLNNTGQAAGYWQAPSGFDTPFVFNPFLPPDGQFSLIPNLPSGVSAQATDINNRGEVTGFFVGGNGFLLSAGKLTTLSFPGATETMALGLNDLGQVVGSYTDAMNNVHGFIYANGVFTALNVPGAPDTVVNGINNFGQIVGFTQQAPNGNTAVGFVGAPLVVPEPSLFSLLALGSTSLIGMCILRSRRSLR